MSTLTFDFQPRQLEGADAILSPSRTAVYFGYGGPKFGGKSWFLRNLGLMYAMRYPGLPVLLLRQTYQDLVDNHVTQLFIERPGIREYYNNTDHVFRLPNGSIIRMGYMETVKDTYNYWGKEYPIILWDEAQQGTEEQFKIVATSRRIPAALKHKFPTLRPFMLMCFNWGDVGHGWLKRLFYDRDFLPQERSEDYHPLITAHYTDNKIGCEADPDYVNTLRQLPDVLRRAYLDGDPNAFTGQFFRGFVVVPTVPVAKLGNVNLFSGLDWGRRDAASSHIVAVDEQGKHTVCGEVYAEGSIPEEFARAVLEARRAVGREVINTFADPSIWAKDQYGKEIHATGEVVGYQQSTVHSIADQMQGVGLRITRANNDRLARWTRLLSLMSQDKFEVMDCCPNLIRELNNAVFNSKAAGRREDIDGSCSDHALDDVGYCCMHTQDAVIPPKPKTEYDHIIKQIHVDQQLEGAELYAG